MQHYDRSSLGKMTGAPASYVKVTGSIEVVGYRSQWRDLKLFSVNPISKLRLCARG